ncbi:hypothetical protein Taro_029334 [Colocasia esculenta]|uniref:Uncharacterized protein n=1 Tax=Colocasia esculenta TaxID=4460 RepID=A0A843VUK7_COLES|nr:hypothetical protein [Colocasia esculenta]
MNSSRRQRELSGRLQEFVGSLDVMDGQLGAFYTQKIPKIPFRLWLRVVGVVFLLVMASRGEMSVGVRIRVSSRPLHPRVLYFLHRHR